VGNFCCPCIGREEGGGGDRWDVNPEGLATAGIVLGSIGLVTRGIFWVLASACDCLLEINYRCR